MPVTDTHPLYDANETIWQRMRDVCEGSDAVKSAGKKYLPHPAGLSDDDYKQYVMRSLFYEAMSRTVSGFVGAIARKDPTIELPASLQPMLEVATSDGMSLFEVIKVMCCETLLEARAGLLVDYDEARKMPYFSVYRVENIVNWSDTFTILREVVYETDPDDRFKRVVVEQYRELSLEKNVYTVTIWRKNDKGDWVIYLGPIAPTARGQTFDAIPFFWLTPVGNTPRIEKPPLLGLADVCISHYQSSADLEWGRHFSGLPTLYVTGVSNQDMVINVGSTGAILLPDPTAQVGYAEVKGNFQSLENALEQKQGQMAVLGASVFHDGPKGVEAAETARTRTSGETSLLMGVTTAVETTLKAALECAAKWASATDTAKIDATLNREFVDTTIDGPTLTGLVAAYQAGAMSLATFLYNLQQGDMLPPETDLEEEANAIVSEVDAKAKKAADLVAKTKGPQT